MAAVVADMNAVFDRDPACEKYSHCMLNFKGFQAIQARPVSAIAAVAASACCGVLGRAPTVSETDVCSYCLSELPDITLAIPEEQAGVYPS